MRSFRLCLITALISVSAVAAPPLKTFAVSAEDSTGCDMLPLNAGETDLALSCAGDFDRSTGASCTAIFKNYGPNACVGKMIMGIGPVTQGVADGGTAEGPISMTCRRIGLTDLPGVEQTGISSIESGVGCEGTGSVPPNGRMKVSVHLTPGTFAVSPWKVGAFQFFTTTASTILRSVVVGQATLNSCNVLLSVPGAARTGVPYAVSWTPAVGATSYEVQQATSLSFNDATTTVTSNTSVDFTNTVSGQPKNYFYKVRATQCRNNPGPFSRVEDVIVIPELPANSRQFEINVLQGSQSPINQQVRFDNLRSGASYTATVDRPYLTVTPATGTVASDGTVVVTVRADPRGLPFGANKGTVTITVALPKTADGRVSLVDNTKSTPVSVTITSPVTAAPKTPPPALAWVVPAVAHKDGIGAQFVSDVKLANVNTTAASSYQLTYTPSASDGSTTGKTTKIDLSPGQQAALGDILQSVFGLGAANADASGVLDPHDLDARIRYGRREPDILGSCDRRHIRTIYPGGAHRSRRRCLQRIRDCAFDLLPRRTDRLVPHEPRPRRRPRLCDDRQRQGIRRSRRADRDDDSVLPAAVRAHADQFVPRAQRNRRRERSTRSRGRQPRDRCDSRRRDRLRLPAR
jgi:hypothetical protein